MKTYQLYLKSHSPISDYEDEYEAENFEEALDHWVNYLGPMGWEKDILAKCIHCDDECDECHTDLQVTVETRDGHFFEEVSTCKGCGFTAVRKGK